MDIICKIIALVIVIVLEIFIGWVMSLIPDTIGIVLFSIYCILSVIITVVLAIGFDEGDF